MIYISTKYELSNLLAEARSVVATFLVDYKSATFLEMKLMQWDVALCSLVQAFWCFRGPSCLNHPIDWSIIVDKVEQGQVSTKRPVLPY